MIVEQTVEVPASHHLTIDVPREVPEGTTRVIIQFQAAVKGQSKDAGFRRALQRAYGAWGDNPSEDGTAMVRVLRDEWDHRDPWNPDPAGRVIMPCLLLPVNSEPLRHRV